MASIKDPGNSNSATSADGHGPGGHSRADEIEEDIQRTRAEMDRTFDALGQKLAPAQLLEDGWDTVREKTAAGAARLWKLAREHPLPALTVGVGLGWLAVDAARGGSSLPARWRRQGARHSRPDTPDTFAREQGEAWQARGGFRELVEERPLAIGAASLAVGLLAGLALPATQREDKLLGDARDELLDSAREVGKEALDKGREVAATAVERVKESIREQELTPEQLAGKARHVARETAETLRDAERQVVGTLTGGGREAAAAGSSGHPGSIGYTGPTGSTGQPGASGHPGSPVGTPPRL